MQNEFDQFADSYDQTLRAALPAGLDEDRYFARYKVDFLAAATRNRNIKSVLDFGCGAGRSLEHLAGEFPHASISGYDPSPESIRLASQRVATAHLTTEWQDIRQHGFDLVFVANVFHHIPREAISTWLARCREILAPQGSIFVFEHNPRNPLTRYVFERCPFDADAEMIPKQELISMGRSADLDVSSSCYTLFFPKPLKIFRPLERWLGWLPIGAQYCVEFGAH